MIDIIPAKNQKDYLMIERLADIIWREHYISIISLEQIEYMLEKYNSVKAITQKAHQGTLFYYMNYQNTPAGYFAIEIKPDYLYVSKLYVLSEYRGNKIAKKTMLFAESMAKEQGKKSIKLHVNKYNANSISAYKKMGFVNSESVVTDIGCGFIMDDYLMIKQLD
ncbi:GNAT family N-acetyltransferase [Litoribaculum gwangyangense]|uniref:N-acetyltransferase domain-containing protein n=1 Tax=Litoribaculum gwangyangense TaxID=1130722 RepID=A0ABP9CH29_9FLAO